MQLKGSLSRGAVEALVVLKYSSTGFVRTHHIEPLVLSQVFCNYKSIFHVFKIVLSEYNLARFF